ncbi:hypothetical protein N665_0402s0021 [Sinapis alba]|nr:hypothetical protein N665_0402s0021 [Sinapis alba]
MEWEYKDQGFKKVFKTKDLRNKKQILILLYSPTAYIEKDISLFYSLTAYIEKDMSYPRLKSLHYPRLTSL